MISTYLSVDALDSPPVFLKQMAMNAAPYLIQLLQSSDQRLVVRSIEGGYVDYVDLIRGAYWSDSHTDHLCRITRHGRSATLRRTAQTAATVWRPREPYLRSLPLST